MAIAWSGTQPAAGAVGSKVCLILLLVLLRHHCVFQAPTASFLQRASHRIASTSPATVPQTNRDQPTGKSKAGSLCGLSLGDVRAAGAAGSCSFLREKEKHREAGHKRNVDPTSPIHLPPQPLVNHIPSSRPHPTESPYRVLGLFTTSEPARSVPYRSNPQPSILLRENNLDHPHWKQISACLFGPESHSHSHFLPHCHCRLPSLPGAIADVAHLMHTLFPQ